MGLDIAQAFAPIFEALSKARGKRLVDKSLRTDVGGEGDCEWRALW